jgi:hypothetical protein
VQTRLGLRRHESLPLRPTWPREPHTRQKSQPQERLASRPQRDFGRHVPPRNTPHRNSEVEPSIERSAHA